MYTHTEVVGHPSEIFVQWRRRMRIQGHKSWSLHLISTFDNCAMCTIRNTQCAMHNVQYPQATHIHPQTICTLCLADFLVVLSWVWGAVRCSESFWASLRAHILNHRPKRFTRWWQIQWNVQHHTITLQCISNASLECLLFDKQRVFFTN